MKTQKNNHIPESGHTYKKYRIITDTCILIYKKLGFTPLQVLEEVKNFLSKDDQEKITFVGRLDPMAEGYIHLLWSGDMEEKQNIQNQDKEYLIEVLFGIKTDTCDILGLIESFDNKCNSSNIDLQKFTGEFVFDYPKYSSPNIKKVLKGENPTNKKQQGYIYDIEQINLKKVSDLSLKEIILNKLSQCEMKGDFRLNQVEEGWKVFFENNKGLDFEILTLKVKCKSGTYMRVLARELGGLALSIVRG